MKLEDSITTESQIKHVQAINELLSDYSKSQADTIKQLKNTLIIVSVCFTLIITAMLIGFFWYESQFETTETTTTTMETQCSEAEINSVTNGDMYNDAARHFE